MLLLIQVGCACHALGDVAASVSYNYKPATAVTLDYPLGAEGPLGLTSLPRFVGGLLLLGVLLSVQGAFLWTLSQRQHGQKTAHANNTGETNLFRDYGLRLLALPGLSDLHSTHNGGLGKVTPKTTSGNIAKQLGGDPSKNPGAWDGNEVQAWFEGVAKQWKMHAWREFITAGDVVPAFRACAAGKTAELREDQCICVPYTQEMWV